MENHKCYRHQQDHGWDEVNEELILKKTLSQSSNELEADRITQMWSIYSSLSLSMRQIALDGILHYSCFPQLSYLSDNLVILTKVDFLSILPSEISFKILTYLDARSLCRSSQIRKKWQKISNNELVWKRMCSQHIDKKCVKCGWGLPLMSQKRSLEPTSNVAKRIKYETLNRSKQSTANLQIAPLDLLPPDTPPTIVVRSWKRLYAERLVVARNWRKARYTATNLIGHTDAVMGLFYDEARALLVTGSLDHTVRVWNAATGTCIAILKGHTQCVRAVQFDESKIVSCSLDKTIRIWNLKTFECVRIIEGHTAGVVSIHFINRFLASGAVDGVIRVWNLEAGTSFTLAGHRDWANKVMILPCKIQLLSSSDDGLMILWDIESRAPIRIFRGHGGPIQSFTLLKPVHFHGQDDVRRIVTGSLDNTIKIWDYNTGQIVSTLFGHIDGVWSVDADSIRVVSASRDHSLKVWDIESATCIYSIQSHNSSINAVWLSDTKLISADDDGIVTVRDFLAPSE